MTSELRLRRPLNTVVQKLDAFNKVTDGIRERKRTTGALISIISVCLILWLVVGEIRFYMDTEFDYKFIVDTEFNETVKLDIDMVVAMPCASFSVDVPGSVTEDYTRLDPLRNMLQQDPTRFELTTTEKHYWDLLKQAHGKILKPGVRNYQSLDDLTFVGLNVLQTLQKEAEKKQREESDSLQMVTAGDGAEAVFALGDIQIIMAGGEHSFGMLQLLSRGPGPKGSACRVHGSVNVEKVSGNVHLTPGQVIPFFGGAGHGHFRNLGTEEQYNFSHRIERFSFGKRIPGLVMPLAGTEQISTDKMKLYQYYLKLVPTRIIRLGALGRSPIVTYQYAVTKKVRSIDHSSGSHGIPGINIKYELSSVMIEVREPSRCLLKLLVRLSAVVGGVFATSAVLNQLLQTCACIILNQLPNFSSNRSICQDEQSSAKTALISASSTQTSVAHSFIT